MFIIRYLSKKEKNHDETTGETELDKEFRSMCENVNNEKSKAVNYGGVISFTFYLIILLFIGLPIWYKTTTPERWPLPDVSRLMVRSQTLQQYYKISIIFFNDEKDTDIDIERLRSYLKYNFPRRNSFEGNLLFIHDWNVRSALPNEATLLEQSKHNTNSSTSLLIELDEILAKIQKSNSIIFYILPKSIRTSVMFNVGNYRSFFVDMNHFIVEQNVLSEFGALINENVQIVEKNVERFYSHLDDSNEDIMLLMSKEFDLMLDIIYEDEDQIYSVYNGNDSIPSFQSDFYMIRKKRHHELMRYIDLLKESFQKTEFSFNRYFRVNIVPQVLHYVWPQPDFITKQLINGTVDEKEQRLFPVSSIESLLTKIESRRIQFNDNIKSYHLVLYVTSSNRSPLKFLKEDRTSNLITTPYRGSILILNDDKWQDLYFGFNQLLRTFFNLHDLKTKSLATSDVRIPAKKLTFITQIEIESCIRALTQKHILKTLQSLESIEKLLNKVSNMVIEQKISHWMQQTMENALLAADLMSTNGNILAAYEHSLVAYSLSEKAFFDPSLLSLLYFPDDQKYAIYLPLFLPIILPIVATIRYYIMAITKMKWKKEKL